MVKEHGLLLYLPPELHLALIKFEAEHEIGRSYAGLLLLTKQLYQESSSAEKSTRFF